jgi:GTPase SAR1 family protein
LYFQNKTSEIEEKEINTCCKDHHDLIPEVKIIVCGSGKSGKSSIVETFINKKTTFSNEPTEGKSVKTTVVRLQDD